MTKRRNHKKRPQVAANAASSGETFSSGSDFISEKVMRSLAGGSGGKSTAGPFVTERTAMFCSAVFACNRVIAESLAILPRDIYRKLPNKTRGEVSRYSTSDVLSRESNRLQTSYKFFETLQHHACCAGNGYAEIQRVRGGGQVAGLWPIPPDRVTPQVIETKGGDLDLIYLVKLNDGSEKGLNRDQVLHIPGLGYDGFQGYPIIQIMLNVIGLGQALEDYAGLFFSQGAGVSGYVSVPDSFSEEQIRNLRKHYSMLNEGLDNAHRFKFLYESAKFQPAGVEPDKAQMLESRVFQIREVARFYRMPLHKIQEIPEGGANYNSLEQFNTQFLSDTMQPWITNWEQELQRKLFIEPGESDYYVKFNVNAMLRGNAADRAAFYRTMVMAGIMSRNECRALEELPPIDGGDDIIIPSNMSSASSDKEATARERIQD